MGTDTNPTGIDEASAVALVTAAATAAGPCPRDAAALAAWEREVRERAFGLLRIVPAVLERSALLSACHPVTGVIVSVREVSGRGLITTRPTMGDRQTEDFRTAWLSEPDGRAMFDVARGLVGRHCRLGKRLEATRDGQKKVGMCEWIEDLGPDPESGGAGADVGRCPAGRAGDHRSHHTRRRAGPPGRPGHGPPALRRAP